jgi:hypothetical protein
MNLKKIRTQIKRTIESSNFSTKIRLYFSQRSVGEFYDPYENNYSYTNLNPITIKGYVRDISPDALIWKQYGLSEIGAKEILCDNKYVSWFKLCNKVEIDSDTYQVYKEAQGNRFMITEEPFKISKIIVVKAK